LTLKKNVLILLGKSKQWCGSVYIPIGSMYAIYGNIYHQYTPNVTIYGIHGSYGICYMFINHNLTLSLQEMAVDTPRNFNQPSK
jgi:hypothetical protein